ncbi:MAG: tRNA (guanosine(37)-N1)-methyltransferase TrmD [Candidatus Omnitrophica bacterium CG08_land_8_20_14_0_20_41_16]|uniref:tRNA (guanine-N(1)-)-methyltransferase n=1 Tax=Candidatus Sherwoodlollariibacterium unditelluris TaxID=1974757 RepID=A0A2G9YKU2_9BACT|nr:MAG: tRNA (guanosine(37)-N1)-methyltransferase TrmD [Candidatus Omnitrophica bacterium CG23_combo_of_CG06-09_8_20_14_all_41_10]PIS33723.1 MAG: tRNA (guanosine(37)-N1)-methyltransferase TrmD [Candidatus Omnitrophica bacterium CG08_land_8_20_14_0_20_41_16]
MRIDILTIFPKMFDPVLNESIIKRAQAKGKVKIYVHDSRDYTLDKHRKVDDRPFGGGSGMVMRPEPIFNCVEAIRRKAKKAKIILLTPQGKTLNQNTAKKLSRLSHLILICGHYEGIDERVRIKLADKEISIGDYVLTGGELPAMVLIDAIVRLIPGVLGDKNSLNFESFEGNLLEYPHYTRPANFRKMDVPEILLSGDHNKIEAWRRMQALKRTKARRPDLLKQ